MFPKVHILKSNPQCDNIWRGAFVRWLGHDSGALIHSISAFIKEARELPCPFCYVRTLQEDDWLPVNQEAGFYQTMNSPVPWSWTSLPLELWEMNLLLRCHPVYGILLEQSEQSQTGSIVDIISPEIFLWQTHTCAFQMFLQKGTCCLAMRNSTNWRPPSNSFTIHVSYQAEDIHILKCSGIQVSQARVMCFSGCLWSVIGQGTIRGLNTYSQAHDDTNEQVLLWALLWPGRDLVSLQWVWRLALPILATFLLFYSQ